MGRRHVALTVSLVVLFPSSAARAQLPGAPWNLQDLSDRGHKKRPPEDSARLRPLAERLEAQVIARQAVEDALRPPCGPADRQGAPAYRAAGVGRTGRSWRQFQRVPAAWLVATHRNPHSRTSTKPCRAGLIPPASMPTRFQSPRANACCGLNGASAADAPAGYHGPPPCVLYGSRPGRLGCLGKHAARMTWTSSVRLNSDPASDTTGTMRRLSPGRPNWRATSLIFSLTCRLLSAARCCSCSQLSYAKASRTGFTLST